MFTENFATGTAGEALTSFTHDGLSFTSTSSTLVLSSSLTVIGTNGSGGNAALSNIPTPSGAHIVTFAVAYLSNINGQNSGLTLAQDSSGNFYWIRLIAGGGTAVTFQVIKFVSGSPTTLGPSVNLSPTSLGDVYTVSLVLTPGSGNLAFAATITNQSSTTVGTYSATDSSPLPTANTFFGISSDFASTATTGLQLTSFGDSVASFPGPTSATFAGPATGNAGAPSSAFTITLNSAALTGGTAITLSDESAGGSFAGSGLSGSTLTIASGQTVGTFTYTRASAGASVITPTSSGITLSPTSLTYTASSSAATATTLSLSASSGYAGVPVTLTVGSNGTYSGTKTGTLSDGGAGGTFSPTTIPATSSGSTASITYTPPVSTITASLTLSATLSGLTAATQSYSAMADTLAASPSSLTTSSTATVTFTGPAGLWTSAPAITVSGLAGCSIGSVTRSSSTSATAAVTTGSTSGTLTFTDGTTGATATLAVAPVALYLTGAYGFTPNLLSQITVQLYSDLAEYGSVLNSTNADIVGFPDGSYGLLAAFPGGASPSAFWTDGTGGHQSMDLAPVARPGSSTAATASALATLAATIGTPTTGTVVGDIAAAASADLAASGTVSYVLSGGSFVVQFPSEAETPAPASLMGLYLCLGSGPGFPAKQVITNLPTIVDSTHLAFVFTVPFNPAPVTTSGQNAVEIL